MWQWEISLRLKSSLGTKPLRFTNKWWILGWLGWDDLVQPFFLSKFPIKMVEPTKIWKTQMVHWFPMFFSRFRNLLQPRVSGFPPFSGGESPRYIATGHSENAAKGEGVKYPEGHTSTSPGGGFRRPVIWEIWAGNSTAWLVNRPKWGLKVLPLHQPCRSKVILKCDDVMSWTSNACMNIQWTSHPQNTTNIHQKASGWLVAGLRNRTCHVTPARQGCAARSPCAGSS